MKYDINQVLSLAAMGVPQCDIARAVGGNRQRILQILQKEGAKRPPRKTQVLPPALTPKQLVQVEGLPSKKAAIVLGVGYKTVQKYRRKHGLKPKEPGGFGSGGSKLAFLAKRRFLLLPRLAPGERTALARAWGVKPTTLSHCMWRAGRRVNAGRNIER